MQPVVSGRWGWVDEMMLLTNYRTAKVEWFRLHGLRVRVA
jgi:hypothetical protein